MKLAKGTCDPSKCSKFFVLGREFTSREAAEEARDDARATVQKVKMTYVVDGVAVDSSSKVSPKAKAAGNVEFVVCDDKTKCEVTARGLLAKAQYEAARSVAAKLAKS